jgi:hypothetical protein
MEAAGKSTFSLVEKIRATGIRSIAQAIPNGDINAGHLNLTLNPRILAVQIGVAAANLSPEMLSVNTTFTCRRRGMETKIIAGGSNSRSQSDPHPCVAQCPQLGRGAQIGNAHQTNRKRQCLLRQLRPPRYSTRDPLTETERSHPVWGTADRIDAGDAHPNLHSA